VTLLGRLAALAHVGLACAMVGVVPVAARAQTSSQAPSPPAGPRWEISFHGGIVNAGTAPRGTSATPQPGPAFVLADGATPSRFVSSWFFGDGAALLNQVLPLRGVNVQLSPLDRPDWPVASPARSLVGARIAGQLSRGVWFEGAVDLNLTPQGFDQAVRDRVEKARADFETAFTALAASAASVITASSVTSTATLAPGGRRLLMSGVLQYRGAERVVRPVLLAGAGIGTTVGGPPTLTLGGTYRFTTPAGVTIEETDTIQLRYETAASFVWVFGGGFMHDLSRSSAYRVEVRVFAGSTKLTTRLDAEPSRVTAPPGAVVVLNATSPGLQFSSSPAITPNLSRTQSDFPALIREGASFRLAVTAGYVRRF
jgi:hypothetical protein